MNRIALYYYNSLCSRSQMKDKRPFSLCGSKFGRLFIIIDYLVESFRPGSVDKFLHGEQKLLLGH